MRLVKIKEWSVLIKEKLSIHAKKKNTGPQMHQGFMDLRATIFTEKIERNRNDCNEFRLITYSLKRSFLVRRDENVWIVLVKMSSSCHLQHLELYDSIMELRVMHSTYSSANIGSAMNSASLMNTAWKAVINFLNH